MYSGNNWAEHKTKDRGKKEYIIIQIDERTNRSINYGQHNKTIFNK